MTPYIENIGYSGTNTSERRARRQTRANHRAEVLEALAARTDGRGLTVVDLKTLGETRQIDHQFAHHGTASGTLSALHRAGAIARLAEERDDCKVYVLPEQINDRPTEPFIGNSQRAASDALVDILHELEERHQEARRVAPLRAIDIAYAVSIIKTRIERLAS